MVDTTPRRRLGRRTLYAATMVAILGASVGFLFATALAPPTVVNQTSNTYGFNNNADSTAFSTSPTVAVAGVPSSVSACTSSAVSLASGGTVYLYLGASSGVTCTTNDFAEEFTFTTSATAPAATYTITVFDNYNTGSALTGVSSGQVTISTALTSAGTVHVYVDFGSSIPSGGIGSLNVVVS
jgi:hypothetical protein